MLSKEKLQEAKELYGQQTVSDVQMLVELADPDGVWSMYGDMGMYEHQECIEFLYFDED
jgi:hypothetical protein